MQYKLVVVWSLDFGHLANTSTRVSSNLTIAIVIRSIFNRKRKKERKLTCIRKMGFSRISSMGRRQPREMQGGSFSQDSE